MINIRMRKDLGCAIPPPAWPAGVRIGALEAADSREIHALMRLAYAAGGGAVDAYGAWWPALTGDSEFAPELCFVAKADDGRIVGVAQCWTSAYVKDLVVHPEWRRRGLGEALLLHAFGVFQRRGERRVDLKVQSDNPSGAQRLYARVGMAPIPDA